MCFMWLSFAKANKTRGWLETPCLIVSSQKHTEERTLGKVEHQWRGSYSYEVDGKTYLSTRYELRGSKWTTKDEEKIDPILETFPTGQTRTCFVNPQDHNYAILKHDSRGAGYSIWFPGLFAVGGVGIIVGAIRKWNR